VRTASRWMFAVTVALLATACATTRPVNLKEARRVVGTENNVRIDAEIDIDRLSPSQTINLKYDISNQRPLPIAVADIFPESSYDSETRTVTIGIGTEVPGEQLLPRLVVIGPGEKKSFVAASRRTEPFHPLPQCSSCQGQLPRRHRAVRQADLDF
jgi:hypothetical protein